MNCSIRKFFTEKNFSVEKDYKKIRGISIDDRTARFRTLKKYKWDGW